jgi:hypothetical protein
MLSMLAHAACAQSLSGDQRVVSSLTGEDLKDILTSEGFTQIAIDEDDDLIQKIEGGVTVSRIKSCIGTAKVSIAAFYREVL